MAASPPTTTIRSTCACGTFHLSIDFPTADLPVPFALCLCTACRRFSGSCGASYIGLPSINPPIDPASFSPPLTAYSTSDSLTRFFCTKCGAQVGFYDVPLKKWALTTGAWDRTEEVVQWTGCKWVEDTLDGGVSEWLTSIVDGDGKERKLNAWMLRGGPERELVPKGRKESVKRKPTEEKLKASCHCGGVKFCVTRPDEASRKVTSPFPDLMVPYQTGASAANPENKPWWLRDNDTKYFAGLCTCKSCRTASGFEFQPWAFIPKCNIFQEDGKPLDFDAGTLRRYNSSDGVWREFCSVCGATVFWHCAERPDLIDVSVGVFDPEEGARVEGWLEWCTERVSFEEMAASKSLVRSMQEGLKLSGEGPKA